MDYAIRFGALVSAVIPAAVLGAALLYATKGRFTFEANKVAFIIGALSALTALVPLAVLSLVPLWGATGSLTHIFAISFLTAALPEEAIKMLVLLTIASRHEDIRRPTDIILAGGFVGLGFGAFENVQYLVVLHGNLDKWFNLGVRRGLTAVPTHMILGLMMGTFAALFVGGPAKKSWLIAALAGPVIFHGLYDVFVFSFGSPIFRAEDKSLIAVGLGAVMATLAWSTFDLMNFYRGRLDSQIFARKGRLPRIRSPILLMATVIGGLGAYFAFGSSPTKSDFLGLIGVAFAWIGIFQIVWLLRHFDRPSIVI